MSATPPLDLGSLGDVDSPEVVKQALRTFRRRTLRSTIWVLVVALMLGIPLVNQLFSKSTMERITTADGYDAGTVYRSRGVTVVLIRVADLGERTGIHLVATADGVEGNPFVFVQIQNEYYPATFRTGTDRMVEAWYEVTVPSDGKLNLRVEAHGGNEEPERDFVIDLNAAGVPERLWRKGGVR